MRFDLCTVTFALILLSENMLISTYDHSRHNLACVRQSNSFCNYYVENTLSTQ